MLTVYNLIQEISRSWIDNEKSNNQSAIGNILKYIETTNRLRLPQKEAIEVYLWLKFVGKNKRLPEIIKNGLLYNESKAKEYKYHNIFKDNYITQFLNQFAQDNELNNLTDILLNNPDGEKFNWGKVLNNLLHDFPYPNYLYSLPMGAGKTYLMACFIYLDLYFANIYRDDKRFGHNFVVLAPSASKTAILPALQTIRNFNPEWILPADDAKILKQKMHIEILDALSSQRRDKLQGNNPNLEKVNLLTQTNDFGLVFITNAEKVVLEHYQDKWQREYQKIGQTFTGQKEFEEIKKTNELRERLSQIPYLTVLLDEVHHTYGKRYSDEKKLRQAVNILNQHKNVVSVIGFSGTPYVKTKIKVDKKELRLNQIQDIVYNYSLADGIGKFLKVPVVKSVDIKEREFIKRALAEFFEDYNITYKSGLKSKMTFYCPSIMKLNEEILPVVLEWYGENRSGKDDEILVYYTAVKKDQKKYKLPKENLALFNNLDKPYSRKRVVLLVAVGTEGWDCKSLTAVVLPRQKTTKNFVLQTTCRCLREVQDAKSEKALIYLEPGNYETLDRELQENYNLNIADLTDRESEEIPVVKRKPRIGKLEFKQVKKKFNIQIQTSSKDYKSNLNRFDIQKFINKYPYDISEIEARIGKSGLVKEVNKAVSFSRNNEYCFEDFLYDLSKSTYGRFTESDLDREFHHELNSIYREILTYYEWIDNHPRLSLSNVLIEVASLIADEISYKMEIVTKNVEIELLEWTIDPALILYGNGIFLPGIKRSEIRRFRRHPALIEEDLEDSGIDPMDISFNYAPYRFDSEFEKSTLGELLGLKELENLEVYYNGFKSEGLQNFQIETDFGIYTPDFLLIKRSHGNKYEKDNDNNTIEKVLIIETKARSYYTDDFKKKEKFISDIFLKYNPRFSYRHFIDEDGKNDFQKHLSEVRKLIDKF